MSAPRGLSDEEKVAWQKLASSVTPLQRRSKTPSQPTVRPANVARRPIPAAPPEKTDFSEILASGAGSRTAPGDRKVPAPVKRSDIAGGLDGHWDKRLKSGALDPDFTLDLHGHTLDAAHDRLQTGLLQAKAMGARVILLIAGKPRPVEAADRGERRGAIRAKILDWLAAGPHGSDVAAVRKAHRRHGGEGALYLVLKRRR